MKKKILSTLLAVCLFVGMAVPAVMAATSDRAGDAKKVTKIVAKESAYTIEVNSDGKNFADEVLVFENDSKLVLDKQHLRYELYGASGDYGAFSITGSTVTAHKAGAEATLTIYDNYNASSNARVTVKLTSAYGAQAPTWAKETFTFVGSNYDVILGKTFANAVAAGATGDSEGLTMQVKAHPAGTTWGAKGAADPDVKGTKKFFALDCKDSAGADSTVGAEIVKAFDAVAGKGANNLNAGVFTVKVNADDNTLLDITLDKAYLNDGSTFDGAVMNKRVKLDITGIERLDSKSLAFSVGTNLTPVAAVDAVAASLDSNEYTVTVGAEIEPKLNYYPPNANVGKGDFNWSIASYDYTNKPYEYATKNGGKILGVDATELAKSRIILNNVATPIGASIVNVKPYAFLDKVTPYVNIESSEITVGTGVTIEVRNLPAGVTVKSWSVKQDGTVVDLQKWDTTNPNRVEGKKVGTATVSATLTNGETYNVNVTVKAAPAAEKPAGGATSNPQTGDSLFANLF